MANYDIQKIKEQLDLETIFNLLAEWGGEPKYTSFGIISATICHNPPGIGSPKLYYYKANSMFHCYTGCEEPSFDIFELLIRVFKIQKNQEYSLYDAIQYIASKIGYTDNKIAIPETQSKQDWDILKRYNQLKEIENKNLQVTLKEYDETILDRLNYSVKLTPWLREGISQEAIDHNRIGFYPGGDQISIPHYDKDGRFVGLRGRSLCEADSRQFGKYRPIFINQQFYSHPLGMNLYNLNNSKDNIRRMGKAIVFESEKAALLYQTYFGIENDISVACCGSNLTVFQVQLLIDAGAKEIIVAFDRQFQEIGDEEFKHLTKNLTKINKRFKKEVLISFIFDKNKITEYKDAPIDRGKEKFLQLYEERIFL